jgi:hypothetical protein
MNYLKAVWSDIRSGENLDLYATVSISVVILILGLLGVASIKVILSATLAVLALVSLAMLANRRQNEAITQSLTRLDSGPVSDRFFKREDDLTQIIGLIRKSRDVWLWGATLSAHLPMLEEEIRNGIERGTNFRVLLINPSGNAINMAAFRAESTAESVLSADLIRNLGHLEPLAARSSGGHLEIRTIDYLGPYVLYLYDPRTLQGTGQVRLTTFRGVNSLRPTFEITAELDREWYGHFVSQFAQVWDAADSWPEVTELTSRQTTA